MVTLICTVRGCGTALDIADRTALCANGHSFDIARSGYINLLQPQDRRSKHPGDSAAAVAARRRLRERGFSTSLTDALLAMLPEPATALDAGCGDGYDAGAIRARFGCETHGTDISLPAIEAASKRYRDCTFVVANADRLLPYASESFDLVLSVTSRLNASGFRRVLRESGTLAVSLPAPDDLVELRAAVQQEGIERDRSERTIAALEPHFRLERRERLHERARLDPNAIADVMLSSYRGIRTRERERLEALGEMDVTLSRDVLLFRTRPVSS